ncbi:response regulator transcription factor [Galactobacter sp.]|uniref:response regulator n=1 Tax=Galactobacter sp. TaxID=2676125 RepID=UPI0025BE2CCC|nr:response regulator transcription factor [Galactobacter sp.]
MIRVLLADDHTVLREGMSLILSVEDDIEVVGQAANGAQALTLAEDLVPDVVLMDIQMPVMDGIEATRKLLATTPATKVVILTTFEREDYLFDAVVAGASGFLLKNTEAEQIVEAVRAVHAGQALLSPEVTLPLLKRVAGESTQVPNVAAPKAAEGEHASSGIAAEDLTPREAEVLTLLATGLSNGEIAAELFIGEATVKTHVSNLLLKLGARDRVQAVVAAYRRGYVSP